MAVKDGDRDNEDGDVVKEHQQLGKERPPEDFGFWRDREKAPESNIADEAAGFKPRTLLVDQLGFNVAVTGLCVLNSVVIGLEQDLAPKGVGLEKRFIWYLLGLMIVGLFLVELGLRIFVQRKAFFADFWNPLDLLLCLGALVDILLLQPAGVGGQLRAFTTVRLLRGIRLVRLLRMFPAFRELWLLVGGLVNSVKALGWVSLVTAIVLFVCSVFVTTEIGHNHEVYQNGTSYDGIMWPYKDYFGTVSRSMFSLLQIMTLDGWCDDIVRHVIHRQPLMGVFFLVFIVITAFGLINVVVGIVVENTLAAAQVADIEIEDQEQLAKHDALQELSTLLNLTDTDRSGELSMRELEAATQSKAVLKLMRRLSIEIDEAVELFRLIDYEQRGKVSLNRYILSLKELIGGARRRDIVSVEITVGTLAQRLDSLDKKFGGMEKEVQALGEMTDDFVQNTVRIITGFDGSSFPKPQPTQSNARQTGSRRASSTGALARGPSRGF